MRKIIGMVGLGLLGWWLAHVYEGSTLMTKANRTCDPVYWLGEFSAKEIISGFTANESEVYVTSKKVTSEIGRGCFYISSRLFKAVSPQFSYTETQQFNTNEDTIGAAVNNNLNE